MPEPTGRRIGFLGAGKMATALAQGWTAAGLVAPDRVVASDPTPAAREAFAAGHGFRTTAANLEVVANSDVLVLAVKPQMMAALLDEIRPAVTPAHLVVSVAAGVTLKQLDHGLGRPPHHPRHAEHAVPGRGQRVRLQPVRGGDDGGRGLG